jgi:hypothetical protein
MAVTKEQFAQRYPSLYHATYAGGWSSIQQHGLLSASALLDLRGEGGELREKIESHHRRESVTIPLSSNCQAVIRDQKPMSESALRRCLVGIGPREWYRLLNQKVFFWVTQERLTKILAAYRTIGHEVLVIDTGALLEVHSQHVRLSHINSGAAGPAYAKRGSDLFKSLTEFPSDLWARRGRRAVAELTVKDSIKDICHFVKCVKQIPRIS